MRPKPCDDVCLFKERGGALATPRRVHQEENIGAGAESERLDGGTHQADYL
jgi:hypothetical protein